MLEVLVELRRQIGEALDELPWRANDWEEGKKTGLDLAWQIVDEAINKLEGKENDR